MQPIFVRPTESFDRTHSLKATFGWSHPSIAAQKLLLPVGTSFPGDPRKEERYREFLRSQTGQSKEHYEGFLRRLKTFKEENLEFMEKGKEGGSGGF